MARTIELKGSDCINKWCGRVLVTVPQVPAWIDIVPKCVADFSHRLNIAGIKVRRQQIISSLRPLQVKADLLGRLKFAMS